jgi:hypothetical protein
MFCGLASLSAVQRLVKGLMAAFASGGLEPVAAIGGGVWTAVNRRWKDTGCGIFTNAVGNL